MDYQVLKSEIDTDTLTRGYAGMTDQEVADSLNNTLDRALTRDVITGKEVKDRIDTGEWAARTDAQKQIVLALVSRDDLEAFGIDATIFTDAMSGATTTTANLAAYRSYNGSRAEELGLGIVTAVNVDTARRGTL